MEIPLLSLPSLGEGSAFVGLKARLQPRRQAKRLAFNSDVGRAYAEQRVESVKIEN
jgi:hypothetical protein